MDMQFVYRNNSLCQLLLFLYKIKAISVYTYLDVHNDHQIEDYASKHKGRNG